MEAAVSDAQSSCLACGESSDRIPIVRIEYQGRQIGICPRHLPILIHDPSRLAGRLAGAERMEPADHQD